MNIGFPKKLTSKALLRFCNKYIAESYDENDVSKFGISKGHVEILLLTKPTYSFVRLIYVCGIDEEYYDYEDKKMTSIESSNYIRSIIKTLPKYFKIHDNHLNPNNDEDVFNYWLIFLNTPEEILGI